MNIIDIVKHGLGANKQRQEILKAAKISDSTISRFLHGRAGLDPFALTRLFVAMGYTLTDKSGNKLITKTNKEQQISENTPLDYDNGIPIIRNEEELEKAKKLGAHIGVLLCENNKQCKGKTNFNIIDFDNNFNKKCKTCNEETAERSTNTQQPTTNN